MTADGLFEITSIPGHLAPTPQRLERLLSKQTLEELYDVEQQPFARGKCATVRRCRERSSGRQWAAKFLRKRRRAQELRAEALHEVAVLDAAAHCSRLVSLHQVFETNTEMVLVLELAPGGELQMVLDTDEIPEEKHVARFLKQILDGVAFLHSLNVAHLDIKPQNLVLTGEFPNCDVKLCDFGLSRYISQGADIREILGTPDYVAPEIINYEPISLATDMWSVGVLLYVLLTGCSPFGGDTKQETFCNISRCVLDFPDDLFEDISEEAQDLVRKLIVKDPSRRLTVTECLKHPWFSLFDEPDTAASSPSTEGYKTSVAVEEEKCKPVCCAEETKVLAAVSASSTTKVEDGIRETSGTKLAEPARNALSPERRETFKKNMSSLAQKFAASPDFVIFESSSQKRAQGSHSISAGEVFKCTPVFILGEEQHCDSGSDTISEISTDSSSDRSSIYSDDSLDFILYSRSQGRASFPYTGSDSERWDQRHPSASNPWPRECSGVVSKALSRFATDPTTGKLTKTTSCAGPRTGKATLEALRERGGNLVVIREPVRAGRYTRYSEVQCESVQARIRRFQLDS